MEKGNNDRKDSVKIRNNEQEKRKLSEVCYTDKALKVIIDKVANKHINKDKTNENIQSNNNYAKTEKCFQV